MSTHVLAALLVAITAGVTDWRHRRIPNWLTMAGLAAGFLLHGVDVLAPLQGAGLALAIHLPLFALRALGGGDVKLMAALGAIAGWRAWLTIFVFSAVLGGVWALALAIRHKALRQTLHRTAGIVSEISQGQTPQANLDDSQALKIPRGVIVAIAVALWAITQRP